MEVIIKNGGLKERRRRRRSFISLLNLSKKATDFNPCGKYPYAPRGLHQGSIWKAGINNTLGHQVNLVPLIQRPFWSMRAAYGRLVSFLHKYFVGTEERVAKLRFAAVFCV